MKKKAPVKASKLAAGLSAAFVSLTLLAGVLAFVFLDNPYNEADKPVMASSSGTALPDEEPFSDETVIPDEISSSDETVSPDAASSEKQEAPSLDPDAPSAPDQESSSAPEAESEPEPVFFNVPDELRAVQIVAGRDYDLPGGQTTPNTIAAQIDKALASAKELTMNSIVIDTVYEDQVLFSAGNPSQSDGMDCVEYMVNQAREQGLYVYATYPVGLLGQLPEEGAVRIKDADGDTLDALSGAAGAFAAAYKLDGILLTDYYNPAGGDAYAAYLQSGGGAGYEEYLRQVPDAALHVAAAAIRREAPGTQIGLLSAAVWENKTADDAGCETAAAFTALGSGNADTRALTLEGLFDFVMVQNFGSTTNKEQNFETVAAWWQGVAKEADKPLYIMHASSKAGTQEAGWSASEQLTTQVIAMEKLSGFGGNAFDSLAALTSNAGNASTMLVKYLNDQINEQYVLTQLALSKPSQLVFTTKEQTVTFQGASDPQEKVTINDEAIPTNESGYFTIKEDLKAGMNTFVIVHKDKSYTYQITREVEVLKSVTPSGNLSVEGGMTVTVSALAYADAQVSASIGGQTISLSPTEDLEDEELRSSGYVMYMGEFTAPAASASVTPLGNITVTATAQGTTKSLQGASVSVNKIASMGAGAVVQVVSDQAETFPVGSLDDKSDYTYFPLPQGTLDMTYGDEVIYNNGKNTYKYWKLQSGMRVYSDDIKAVGERLPDNNKITDMRVKSSGQYTTVTLTTEQKVPFKVSYDGSQLTFAFQYTASAPESGGLSSNALFTDAAWNGTNLTLSLKKAGGFLGYKASYDGNDLILRFNNSPGSLKGARVAVDPGHGGNDPGAPGFYPGKDEADINAALGSKLVAELKGRGASVLTTSGSLSARVEAARAFNPQAFVSVHCNSSATNSKAAGTEVYYFNAFSKPLASAITSQVASALGTDNRGAKFGLYYVTRVQQYPAVLVETGFVSNEKEYTKLINSKYQNRIAEAIANGVNSFFGGTNSGSFKSNDAGDEEEDEESDTSSGDNGDRLLPSGKLTLNKTSLSLNAGKTATLTAKRGNKTADVDWESDNNDIAEVDADGVVTGVGAGTTYIYATLPDGSAEAKCKVTVKGEATAGQPDSTASPEDGVRVASVTLSGGGSLRVGELMQITGSVSPANAQDTGIEWTSSDENVLIIAAYDDSSCKVEAVGTGTAILIGRAYDNKEIKQEISITVR